MASNPSSTPIAPQGMGPRSVFLLLMLLLGLGAFYWLSHDPNVLDAYSDLKRTFETPSPAPPAAVQPTAPSPPPSVGERIANSPEKSEEERIRKKFDEELAKLEKEVAEANGQSPKSPAGRSPLVFIAEPTCAPIGRQWLVSGHVSNSSDKAASSKKATITLLIDGEPAETQTVEIGPFAPRGVQSYEVLFRPDRNTRHHTVTASVAWKG